MQASLKALWKAPRRLRGRRILFYVHMLLGLTLGALVSVVCLTGSMVVFKPEIESSLLGSVSHISVPADPRTIALQKAYDLVHDQYSGCRITQAYLHQQASLSWSFDLNCKPRGRIVVYVDKYRGEITGEDRFEHKWTQWIYDLHVHLLSGRTGETINGIGALLFLVLAATGVVVWWPGIGSLRSALRFETRARWRRRNYDLHRIIGFYTSLLLMFVALTGAYFAFPRSYEAVVAWVAQAPSVLNAPRTPVTVKRKLNLDDLYRAAITAMPEGETTLFTFPQQKDGPYSVRRMLPGDWRRTGDNLVYLDQYTGAVIRTTYHRDLAWPIRLTRDIYPLHFGTFAGVFSRLLWLILGIAPSILYVTGVIMWWNRSLAKCMRSGRAGDSRESAIISS